jgi:hypothetical protein
MISKAAGSDKDCIRMGLSPAGGEAGCAVLSGLSSPLLLPKACALGFAESRLQRSFYNDFDSGELSGQKEIS